MHCIVIYCVLCKSQLLQLKVAIFSFAVAFKGGEILLRTISFGISVVVIFFPSIDQ